jgi:phosphoserine phosphatase RsbU/P
MFADAASLQRQLSIYKGLVEVSALINGITDTGELLPAILDVARRVLSVEAASLFLVNDAGELEMVAARSEGREFPARRIVVPPGRGISGWVFETGQPLLVADAYGDPRFYRETDRETGFTTRSLVTVPLSRGDRRIGVLQGLNPIGREAFDEADLEAFSAYGVLAATAIDKLRTLEREREQERAAQESAFAHEIQMSFLPTALPQPGSLGFAATYRPALHVGGDFYDVIETGPDELYFAIGDVSGKGIPAALLMAQAISILRLSIQPGIAPDAALARWNERIIGHTIRGMFITALVGRILLAEKRVEIASAGHCAPFLVSAGGEPREIRVAGCPPLGILPQLKRQCQSLTLSPGDWFVLYTDGLVESFNGDDVPLDPAGVAQLLARPFSHASDVVDALNRGEINHRGRAEPHDDLTVLVFGFR